jgi:hypothetical protein
MAVAISNAVALAGDRPAQPDCMSNGIQPVYAPLDAPPVVQATRIPGDDMPPAGARCFEKTDSAATWVTVASYVQTSNSLKGFIERLGSISTLSTVQYWSTTEQKWRPMVTSASAISSVNSRLPRADYSLTELTTGTDLYYSVTDSRSGHPVAYRLRVLQDQPTELLAETANVDAIRQWGITVYAADGLHTLYFLKKQSAGVWAYYSITRVLPHTFLAAGHDKSVINRAIALYRHIVGLPTDAEPPAAR